MTLIDKGRPELGHVKNTRKPKADRTDRPIYTTADNFTAAKYANSHGRDMSRQSISKQLSGLRHNLEQLTKQLKAAIALNRTEKVYILCAQITKQRGRFLDLVAIYEQTKTDTQVTTQAEQSDPLKPLPAKRYKTFSDI